MPFTNKQRDAIRARDSRKQTVVFLPMEGQKMEVYIQKFEKYIKQRDSVYGQLTCMFPHEKGDVCSGVLRPHYIRPIFWAEKRTIPMDTILHQYNVVTICEKASSLIDPSFIAMIKSEGNREIAMKRLQEKRYTRARQGIPYWNTFWDRKLKIIARHLSWITQPDNLNKEGQMMCQFPHWYKGVDIPVVPCNGHILKKNDVPTVEVHHIKPQGWAIAHNVVPEEVDDPFIALTICKNAHHMCIHPDMLDALAEYRPEKTSFQEVFEARKEDIELGLKYWNSQWDEVLLVISEHQTRVSLKNGWVFPAKIASRIDEHVVILSKDELEA